MYDTMSNLFRTYAVERSKPPPLPPYQGDSSAIHRHPDKSGLRNRHLQSEVRNSYYFYISRITFSVVFSLLRGTGCYSGSVDSRANVYGGLSWLEPFLLPRGGDSLLDHVRRER